MNRYEVFPLPKTVNRMVTSIQTTDAAYRNLDSETSTPPRRATLRVPLFVLSNDGLIALQNAKQNPRKNRLQYPSVPAHSPEIIEEGDHYRRIIGKFFNMTAFARRTGSIDSIEPLGYYRTFIARGIKTIRERVSIPAVVSLNVTAEEVVFGQKFQRNHGIVTMHTPTDARTVLETCVNESAVELPATLESLAFLDVFEQEMSQADATHS